MDKKATDWTSEGPDVGCVTDVLPDGVSISWASLQGTAHLFEVTPGNTKAVRSRQDVGMAFRLAECSALPIPSKIGVGEFVAVPLDMMAYTTPDGKGTGFTCLEFNTIG